MWRVVPGSCAYMEWASWRRLIWLCLSQLSPVPGSRPSCQSMSPGDCWRVLSMSSGPRCCSAAVRAMHWRAAGCYSARPMGHGALEKSSRSVEVSHKEPWHGHLQDGTAAFLYAQLRECEHVGSSYQRCPWDIIACPWGTHPAWPPPTTITSETIIPTEQDEQQRFGGCDKSEHIWIIR